MRDARTLLFEAVMESAERRPVAQRAQLYRAAAEFAGSPRGSAEFVALAEELETADRRCREFGFRLTGQGGSR